MDDEIDIAKLKYVLYARKSTDDPTRQLRSIPDQIIECQQLARRRGLNVVSVLQETKSAKTPGQRPIFRKMLLDIKAGLYDGVLCWNPDRLARNMLEGGEIINMIDEGQIKDLQFVTHYFTNDASGKMLLGMAFVLSKQYSDKLSQDVTRGVRANFAEGKSPAPKHGYVRGEDGYYDPDGKNFELICEAWQERKDGTSVENITEGGYCRLIKRSGKKTFMTMQKLSEIFRDPFYYGVLVQAGKLIDLRLIYDFKPAVTQEDYDLVQSLTYRRMKPTKPHKLSFYPLRLMVLCSYCGRTMRVAPSTGNTKRYLFIRCDNASCVRNDKSNKDRPRAGIRSKIVFDFIYDFLAKGLNFTEQEYRKYLDGLTSISETRMQKLTILLHSKEGSLKNLNANINELSLNLGKFEKDSRPFIVNQDKIVELDAQEKNTEQEITDLKKRLSDPEQDRLSVEQFLNLSKNAAAIVQAGNAVVKDKICRLIFLNFTVDEEKVLSYQLKEPFATLLKGRTFLSSRGDRSRTCHLSVPNRAFY